MLVCCVKLCHTNLDMAILRRVRVNVLVKEGILGAILLIMGVFDRLYIDWRWVGPHQSVDHPRHRGPDALHKG